MHAVNLDIALLKSFEKNVSRQILHAINFSASLYLLSISSFNWICSLCVIKRMFVLHKFRWLSWSRSHVLIFFDWLRILESASSARDLELKNLHEVCWTTTREHVKIWLQYSKFQNAQQMIDIRYSDREIARKFFERRFSKSLSFFWRDRCCEFWTNVFSQYVYVCWCKHCSHCMHRIDIQNSSKDRVCDRWWWAHWFIVSHEFDALVIQEELLAIAFFWFYEFYANDVQWQKQIRSDHASCK